MQRGCKLKSRRWESACCEYHECESGVGNGGKLRDGCGCELWSDAGNKHDQIQRNGSNTDELECDQHRCASPGGSDDGKCCRDSRRSGEQRSEFHGHSGGFRAEHYEFESDVGSCGNFSNNQWRQFWSDSGDQHR